MMTDLDHLQILSPNSNYPHNFVSVPKEKESAMINIALVSDRKEYWQRMFAIYLVMIGLLLFSFLVKQTGKTKGGQIMLVAIMGTTTIVAISFRPRDFKLVQKQGEIELQEPLTQQCLATFRTDELEAFYLSRDGHLGGLPLVRIIAEVSAKTYKFGPVYSQIDLSPLNEALSNMLKSPKSSLSTT